ncbi:MAG TPA: hypothetical protein VJU82_13065 [Acidobacteriaceae bacterium]|nr:hypothetical protein [Acidobacteriaceae bacterium]
MDPTLAALLGAGIGTVGTILAASITSFAASRREHKVRRRELMREAYAEGLRAVVAIGRIPDQDSHLHIHDVRMRMFEAQVQIRLVGSPQARDKFDDLAEEVFEDLDRWEARALSQEESTLSGEDNQVGPDSHGLYRQFLEAAWRDLGV